MNQTAMPNDIGLSGLIQKEPVYEIPLDDILADYNFNVRGFIPRADVVELAKDIDRIGLLQAITVQPWNQPPYKYRIVVGHRRYEAFRFLDKTTIPATVKKGLSELDAHVLNFTENVHRKDLNILQEALGLKWFRDQHLTLELTSKKLQKPIPWIMVRFQLLDLPEEIQEKAAAGWISQEQIRHLSKVPDRNQQFDIVKKIIDSKIAGEKRIPPIKKKKSDPTKRKRRDYHEVADMLVHIYDTLGPNEYTRALAWANGDISDIDLYRDLIEKARKENIRYSVPDEIKKYIS